jgi:hypothetical protein
MKKLQFIILELLIIAECILARTKLDGLQIGIELFLIIYFLLKTISIITKKNYLSFLFILFIFMTIISSFLNTPNVAILNAKIYLLGFLSIIYFKYNEFKFVLLKYYMFINIFLILYQHFTGVYLLSFIIDNYGSTFDSSYPRPIGLFFSPHESLNILAIYLLYNIYFYKNRIIRLLIIYYGEVSYVLAAFFGQLIVSFKLKSNQINVKKNIKLKALSINLFFIIFLLFFIIINLIPEIKNIIINYDWPFLLPLIDEGRIFGIQVILSQFLDYKTYIQIFTIFPRDYNFIQEGFWHFAGNEIMYFQLIQQGGIILFFFYLKYLLNNTAFFNIFIIISLFHYGDVITPLSIGMFVIYSKEIKTLYINEQK